MSSAEVLSSRKTALGLVSRMRAKATRCCSPGESTLAQSRSSSSRSHSGASATLVSVSRRVASGMAAAELG
ncbi:Protein of uncharacterised function (DUF1602) [Mycobacterium tuberculosis]|uniref:Protein of uncharacterized function (DUF1602) n=1 Tax=Mycobacterium tuberculosis TaxID=1773 RepID=A0A916LEN5_MYCTX|nr:Protein of uncharacterised function (DUF1602) [Mycobacterium tuberculosis]COZ54785.1 Protein of uncharacterised function (DUF1602) [Mycobacterium tuberculosis]